MLCFSSTNGLLEKHSTSVGFAQNGRFLSHCLMYDRQFQKMYCHIICQRSHWDNRLAMGWLLLSCILPGHRTNVFSTVHLDSWIQLSSLVRLWEYLFTHLNLLNHLTNCLKINTGSTVNCTKFTASWVFPFRVSTRVGFQILLAIIHISLTTWSKYFAIFLN
jgi:hypothetical protein